MSLVCGDLHGNYAKAKAFLDYKPEEEHIFVGDYVDSFIATDTECIETMKLCLESNAICLFGNHDLHYLFKPPFQCSGFRPSLMGPILHLLNTHSLKAAHVADGYLITHGGVHPAISKPFSTPEETAEYINSEMDDFKKIETAIYQQGGSKSHIFNIGSCRGGWHMYSGPFWADYRSEKLDKRFDQVFGHSHTGSMKEYFVGKAPHRKHVCVDAPQFHCYNTATEKFEDFFPPEVKHVQRELLEKTY